MIVIYINVCYIVYVCVVWRYAFDVSTRMYMYVHECTVPTCILYTCVYAQTGVSWGIRGPYVGSMRVFYLHICTYAYIYIYLTHVYICNMIACGMSVVCACVYATHAYTCIPTMRVCTYIPSMRACTYIQSMRVWTYIPSMRVCTYIYDCMCVVGCVWAI